MDVLDHVRDIGADVELTESQVADARTQGARRAATDESASRRRLWIGIGGAGGALAAAARRRRIVVAVTTPQATVGRGRDADADTAARSR